MDTKPTKAELRRTQILEAALRLVCREGVRGIRHRAVAKEAQVPLSATTYYFKDINDLISETFLLFATNAMAHVVAPTNAVLEAGLQNPDAREGDAAVNLAADVIAQHIESELSEKRDHLLAEQAFLHEALLNPQLATMAEHYYQHLVDEMEKLCEVLAIPNPSEAADIVVAVIFRVERQGLALNAEPFDVAAASHTLRRVFHGLLTEGGVTIGVNPVVNAAVTGSVQNRVNEGSVKKG